MHAEKNEKRKIMYYYYYFQLQVNNNEKPKAHRAALISVCLAFSQTPVYTARRGTSLLRGMPVYVPAFATVGRMSRLS